MRQYLGIGLRIESIAFTGELIFQFLIVLNDAVVEAMYPVIMFIVVDFPAPLGPRNP